MPVIGTSRNRILYANDGDLTVDGVAMTPEQGQEEIDVTTFDDGSRRVEPGLRTATVSYSGLYTAAAAGAAPRSYDVLTNLLGSTAAAAVSYFSKTDASGEIGVGMSTAYVESAGFQGGPGDAESIDASFIQDGDWDLIQSLGTKTTSTADTTYGTVDRGASSTAGGVMYVHVFANAASGGNTQWILRLQHASLVGGVYNDAATLTVGSGTTIGTAIVFTGTFRQFVRGSLEEDSTTGTISYQISFAAR